MKFEPLTTVIVGLRENRTQEGERTVSIGFARPQRGRSHRFYRVAPFLSTKSNLNITGIWGPNQNAKVRRPNQSFSVHPANPAREASNQSASVAARTQFEEPCVGMARRLDECRPCRAGAQCCRNSAESLALRSEPNPGIREIDRVDWQAPKSQPSGQRRGSRVACPLKFERGPQPHTER